MNISVVGGPLYQWDLNRQIEITYSNSGLVELHFSYKFDECSMVVKPKNIGGRLLADIPNEHLQRHGILFCYVVDCSAGGIDTVDKIDIPVIEKGKPTDYVYTPSEILSYSTIVNRLTELEKNIQNNTVCQQGPQGPKGDTGERGPAGIKGSDGLSAYEIAVKNGFVGSEQEWLDSLQGAGSSGSGGSGGSVVAGLSAYEIAVKNGFKGSELQWLESLKGVNGNTPVKGTDYFTASEKTEFVYDVISALPVYRGGYIPV